MTMDNVAFEDLPAEAFPFRYWVTDVDTGEILQHDEIPGPAVIAIPAFAPRVCRVWLAYANGQRTVTPPPPRGTIPPDGYFHFR